MVGWGPTVVGTVVVAVLAVFWVALQWPTSGFVVASVRIVTGLALLLIVPGALTAHLCQRRASTSGTFALVSVAVSLAVLGVLTPAAAVVLPLLGIDAPLSPFPLAVLLTLVIGVLTGLVYHTDTVFSMRRIDLQAPVPVLFTIFALPGLAAVSATAMNRFDTNVGMFVFVGVVSLLVIATALRVIPSNIYPVLVFAIAFSTLLHRNLLTNHVVGADIQGVYFAAELVGRTHQWSPEMGGVSLALPVVTTVPSTISLLTGLELTTTFKVVYAFLFALVPVGVFYLSREIFDEDIGFFGAMFFVFYHGSFYFTPGKQLISELFVVTLLWLFVHHGFDTLSRKAVAALLATGLIFSHYGMSYVLGLSLLVAWVALTVLRGVQPRATHRLSVTYPLFLLGGATAWYSYASDELTATLASIPASLASQVSLVLTSGTVSQSGTSYVSQQSALLESLQLYLYILFTVLLTIGIGWCVIIHLRTALRGNKPQYIEYTAIAVPVFVFLASSYFLTINLWADRAYQLALVVLAPFTAFGFFVVFRTVFRLAKRWSLRPANSSVRGTQWVILAVLLVSLLAFNAGAVFSLAGESHTSTFNPNAHDLAFSQQERAGVQWIESNGPVDGGTEYLPTPDGAPGQTPIYTDSVTNQLFRSELPSNYYNTDTVLLKSDQQPTLDPNQIDDGYVFIRERSVDAESPPNEVQVSELTPRERRLLTSSDNVVYSNGAVTVVRSERRDTSS